MPSQSQFKNLAHIAGTALILIGQVTAHQGGSKSGKAGASLELYASPLKLAAHYKQPISIWVAIRNVSNRVVFARLQFDPCPPSELGNSKYCLKAHLRDQKTGVEFIPKVRPVGIANEGIPTAENAYLFRPGSSMGAKVEFQTIWTPSPGSYTLELQYQTGPLPKSMKPDPAAWHGVTNKVNVEIQILK